MSYIGNAPTTAAFLVDTFSGTGSQTAFTMTVAPANTSSILVSITGVVQDPSTYSVSGTTLTFSAAPPSGTSNISVRYLGIPASGVTTTAYRTVTNTTATAGQTSFTIPSYTVGYVDVYRNGVYLPTSDYTATTGTTVVLNNAATAGDTITTISFYVSSVLNAIPATAGSVSSSNIVSGVSLTSPTLSAPTLTGTATATTITSPASTALNLQSNNGTTGISIDASQRITTPYQPALVATVTSSKTISAGTNLQFDSIVINRNSAFTVSISNSRFAVPITGYYVFSFSWFLGAASNDSAVNVKVNGSQLYRIGANIGGVTGTASNLGGGSVIILSLSANDYIEIDGSGSKTILGASPVHSVMSLYLLG